MTNDQYDAHVANILDGKVITHGTRTASTLKGLDFIRDVENNPKAKPAETRTFTPKQFDSEVRKHIDDATVDLNTQNAALQAQVLDLQGKVNNANAEADRVKAENAALQAQTPPVDPKAGK